MAKAKTDSPAQAPQGVLSSSPSSAAPAQVLTTADHIAALRALADAQFAALPEPDSATAERLRIAVAAALDALDAELSLLSTESARQVAVRDARARAAAQREAERRQAALEKYARRVAAAQRKQAEHDALLASAK